MGDAGSAEGSFGDNKIIVKKAAPGTFFALFGAIVICVTIFKGLDFVSISEGMEVQDEKPTLID
ncbi:hypothetical protein [Colwellia sp. Arc7-635]|uniref:hypothetical protein n=1 Tax=Colwellia sp. Arc7-635 TaxID=2497879 RepID=UPI0019D2A70E|nr:hypothetical protein [Colwellia sp. Arc7-635]